MNSRLTEIIKYKTGGKQTEFAELMGWSPQYLAKLTKGDNFGLQPVLSVLSSFPEINARWFLFGEGDMLETSKMFDLQINTMNYVLSLLDLNKYIPVMNGAEIKVFEMAMKNGAKPCYSAETIADLDKRLAVHNEAINSRIEKAIKDSDKLCKQRTASK